MTADPWAGAGARATYPAPGRMTGSTFDGEDVVQDTVQSLPSPP
jgi:hypothetical protein